MGSRTSLSDSLPDEYRTPGSALSLLPPPIVTSRFAIRRAMGGSG